MEEEEEEEVGEAEEEEEEDSQVVWGKKNGCPVMQGNGSLIFGYRLVQKLLQFLSLLFMAKKNVTTCTNLYNGTTELAKVFTKPSVHSIPRDSDCPTKV